VEYIVQMMESEDFVSNNISTAWLDARIASHAEVKRADVTIDARLVATVGGACVACKAIEQRLVQVQALMDKGQLVGGDLLNVTVPVTLIFSDTMYAMCARQTGPRSFTITVDGCQDESGVHVDVRQLSDGGFLVLTAGNSHLAYLSEEAGGQRLQLNGRTFTFEDE
jgi:acetyl-CoA carboxylase/biotin carboxylase 1